MNAPLLQVEHLSIAQGTRTLCADLTLHIQRGDLWLILGQNGCGKSTLLSTLSGWHRPAQGDIWLAQQALRQYSSRERAKRLAWMPQHDQHPFPTTVLEQVLTGCHTRLGRFAWESLIDQQHAQRWLGQLDLAGLAQRELATLSGGEQRRVALATAFMQQAPLLLLDEPLSQLDLHHQQQTLQLLKQHAAEGHGVMMVSHDPNHARYCSHALLLFGDGRWQAGTVAQVCTTESLSALYQTPILALTLGDEHWFVMR